MNLDKLFHLKENHTDVKTEIMAGIHPVPFKPLQLPEKRER